MARVHVYGDESGNFDWSHPPKGTKYFILTTVVIQDHGIEAELLSLRRELAWSGVNLWQHFHATEDDQAVRDRVFEIIARHDIRVDATILEKAKAQPHLRRTPERFYQYAWFYHMKHVTALIAKPKDELFIVAASVSTKAKRSAFQSGVEDVMQQVSGERKFQTVCWPAAIDPCLQVADYCCWAVQRRFEGKDNRSYDLISHQVSTMYNLFLYGTTHHY
ncbi:MAG: DUF3800 domain-containing protein [Dehalococcoidia bacterium]|nr:DUF3800 domain-containing protein [Dehalococcoidia bacterium]